MNVDELSSWLDENGQFDGSPWSEWFNDNYCKKCKPIKCTIKETSIGVSTIFPGREIECSYCELEKKCKFFKQMEDIPTNKDVIKMWLKSKIKEK